MLNWKSIKTFAGKRTTFVQMQFFTTVLLLFLTMVSLLVVNTQFSKRTTESFGDACSLVVDEIEITMELIISNIIETGCQAYNDPIINQFIRETGSLDYSMSSAIMNKVKQIKNSSSYIESVYIYARDSGNIATTSYGITTIDQTPDKGFIEWFDLLGSNTITLINTHPVQRSNYNAMLTYDAISVFIALPYESVKHRFGAIVININQNYLYSKLFDKQGVSDKAEFFVLDSDKRIILTSNQDILYKDISAIGISNENEFELNTKKIYEETVNGSPYLAVYKPLPKTDWAYYFLFEMEQTKQTIRDINKTLILLFLAILAFGILLMTIFFLRETEPIDKIMVYIRDELAIKTKGRRYFTGVFDAVTNVFDNNKQLRRELGEARPILRERFLISLINGVRYSDEALLTRFRNYFGIEFSRNAITLGLLLLEDYDNYVSQHNLNPDLIIMTIYGIVHNKAIKQNIDAVCVHTDISEIVLIVRSDDLKLRSIHMLISQIQNEIQNILGLKVSASLCDNEHDIKNIRKAYKSAKQAMRYRSFYEGDIIYYSDIDYNSETRCQYPFEIEEKLHNAIRLNNEENATRTLEALIDRIISDNQDWPRGVFLAIVQLYSSLLRLANELNIKLHDTGEDGIILQSLFEVFDRQKTTMLFMSYVRNILSKLSDFRNDRVAWHYNKIRRLINNRYMDSSLSLDAISDEIGLSPSYITRILKNYGNCSFSQLLTDIRMQKSHEYLRESDLKVAEIAERVGFSSSKYFINVFKKSTGMTPGQFKRFVNK